MTLDYSSFTNHQRCRNLLALSQAHLTNVLFFNMEHFVRFIANWCLLYITSPKVGHRIGILLFCFECGGRPYCIVQHISRANHGAIEYEQHKNDFECPLLSRSKILQVVPSTGIMRSISLVRECGTSCGLREMRTNRTVEIQGYYVELKAAIS